MTTGLHDSGEEYEQRVAGNDLSPVTSAELTLFNDSNDSLSDSSDVSAITEPSGGSFARQSAAFPGDLTLSFNGSNNFQNTLADQTFDTSDSSLTVDSYAVVINYQQTADGSAADHLYFTGGLNQSFDLSGIDELVVSGAALILD
jgi:hypothetical protein